MQQKKQNEVTTAKKYAEYRRAKEQARKKKRPRPRAPKWLKNPLTWAALTAVVAVAAFGVVYFVNRSRVVEPASGIPGYYSMAQTIMGGGVEGAALSDVRVAVDGDDTVITLQFDGGLPAYSVSALSDPARVIVSMRALSGWEHSSTLNSDGQSLVLGMFRNEASEAGVTELYFQTTRQIGYQISEQGQELVLRLRALDETAETGYYVTLGAYEAYCAGLFDAGDMTPVLCADGASVALISTRYDTRVEAEAFAQTLDASLSEALPGVTSSVVQLSGNEAPPLSDAAERATLSAAEVYRPYTGQAEPWLWTTNARLLEWMPDMKRALFTRQTAALSDDEGEYCELWLYDQAGKGQRLLDVEFRTITEARFAHAGDALAFVEATDSEYLLYYYSLTGGNFVSLGDLVGGNTYGFDFALDGSLYLVGGVYEPRLTRWDPTVFGDSTRMLEDMEGLIGSLSMGSSEWSPNTLYMSDGETSTYEFDMSTGERRYLTEGGEFEMSPDRRYLVLMEYDESIPVDTYTGLKLRDLSTGQETPIYSGEAIGDVCWSSGGARVYFLTYNEDAATSEAFPSVLHVYDLESGQAQALGLINTLDIGMGANDAEISFVTSYQNAAGRYQWATYRVNVG